MVAMYVTKSPKRGTYSYRRKIPMSLQKLWGKLEIKQSLKTKDYSVALARAAKVNQNFEQKAKHLQSKLNDDASSPTPDQIWFTLEEASALLKKHGLHPDQAPIPGIASKQ